VNEESITILRKLPIFSDLDDTAFALVCSVAKTKWVKKNTLLFSKGDDNRSMYIIKSGSADVSVYTENGRELILSTLLQGDYYGELSLLDGLPISTNITSTSNCEIIFLHKNDFFSIMHSNPSVSFNIIHHLCEKIRELTEKSENFALKDVYERLAQLLTDFSVETDDGNRLVNMPLTHKSMALRIGSSREMVSRVMKELETGGYISTQNKIIIIHKKLPSAW